MNNASIMLDIEGTSLTDEDKKLVKSPHVGGLILFSRNFENKDQLIDLCFEIKSIKPEILIATDQEGGRVQRFKDGFSEIPSMQRLGDLVAHDAEKGLSMCRKTGWLMATEMIATGIDLSFAPVLDIDRNTSSIIGNRSFSNKPQNVVDIASHFIQGMSEAGMKATGKHFPGHGGIKEDSHIAEPIDIRSHNELMDTDLKPFIELKDKLSAVMTAHITYPDIDNVCVSFSKIWLKNVLQNNIGFNGVIFSDDLTMKGAGNTSMDEKAIKALNAGCDMVLVCNDYKGANSVINCFEKEDIDLNSRIGMMQKTKTCNWDDLADNPRVIETKQIIKTLGEI